MPDTVCLVDLIYLVVDLICLVVLTGCYLPGGRPDMHGSPDRHGGRPDMPGRPDIPGGRPDMSGSTDRLLQAWW